MEQIADAELAQPPLSVRDSLQNESMQPIAGKRI
jgi:hypothetical protein